MQWPAARRTKAAGRLRGVNCAREGLVAYAAGGKGGPATPAPPAMGCAPWNPKLMQKHRECQVRMALGRWMQEHMIQVSAYRSHESMHQSCGKHHLQGVWGAARHPSGEREGPRPLAFAKQHNSRYSVKYSVAECL
jgi:hypothetical protein